MAKRKILEIAENFLYNKFTDSNKKGKSLVTDSSTGEVIFEAKNNHQHSEYVNPTIATNLTTNDDTKVLSAKQGYNLQQNKLNNKFTDSDKKGKSLVTDSSTGEVIFEAKNNHQHNYIPYAKDVGATNIQFQTDKASKFYATINELSTITHGTTIILYNNTAYTNGANATLSINNGSDLYIYLNGNKIKANQLAKKGTYIFMYNTTLGESPGCWQIIMTDTDSIYTYIDNLIGNIDSWLTS